MARSRSTALSLLMLAMCAWVARYGLSAGGFAQHGISGRTSRVHEVSTRLAARGGDAATLEAKKTEDADSVEVGGFSAFVVGVALLPYVGYCLLTVFNVVANGKAFDAGPYGLELISCITTVCLTIWSLGSFVQRGCGLPGGPLGLLGLAEGLSYLGTLGLVVAAVALNVRGGGSLPSVSLPAVSSIKAPEIKVPDVKVPELKAPAIKVPDIKAPDFKAPDFKAPAFKVPEIKVPEVKVPEVKVPEVKVPEVKIPEVKIPEVKKPEAVPEKAPAAKPEKKSKAKKAEEAPAPKAAEVPAKPKFVPEPRRGDSGPDDLSDLFN